VLKSDHTMRPCGAASLQRRAAHLFVCGESCADRITQKAVS
jgi:hypothetical protein